MSDTPTYLDAQGRARPERRANHQVRAVFDRAWELIEPILDAGELGAEATGFAISRKLRDHFPDLSSADLHTLVSAAMRLQRERRGKERVEKSLAATG